MRAPQSQPNNTNNAPATPPLEQNFPQQVLNVIRPKIESHIISADLITTWAKKYKNQDDVKAAMIDYYKKIVEDLLKPAAYKWFGKWDQSALHRMGVNANFTGRWADYRLFIDDFMKTYFGSPKSRNSNGNSGVIFGDRIEQQVVKVMARRTEMGRARLIPGYGRFGNNKTEDLPYSTEESPATMRSIDLPTPEEQNTNYQAVIATANQAIEKRSRTSRFFKWVTSPEKRKTITRAAITFGVGATAAMLTGGASLPGIFAFMAARQAAVAATVGAIAAYDAKRGERLGAAVKRAAVAGTLGVVMSELVFNKGGYVDTSARWAGNLVNDYAIKPVGNNILAPAADYVGGTGTADSIVRGTKDIAGKVATEVGHGYSKAKVGLSGLKQTIYESVVTDDPATIRGYEIEVKRLEGEIDKMKTTEFARLTSEVNSAEKNLEGKRTTLLNAQEEARKVLDKYKVPHEMGQNDALRKAQAAVKLAQGEFSAAEVALEKSKADVTLLKNNIARMEADVARYRTSITAIEEKIKSGKGLIHGIETLAGTDSAGHRGFHGLVPLTEPAPGATKASVPSGDEVAVLAESDKLKMGTGLVPEGVPSVVDPKITELNTKISSLEAGLKAKGIEVGDLQRKLEKTDTLVGHQKEIISELEAMVKDLQGKLNAPVEPTPELKKLPERTFPPGKGIPTPLPDVDPRIKHLPKSYVIDGVSGKKSFWDFLKQGGFTETEIANGYKNPDTLNGVTANLKAMLTEQFYAQQEAGKKTLKLTGKGLNKLLNMSPEVFMRHLPEGFKITPEALRVPVEEVLPDDTPAPNPTNPLAKRFEYA